MQDRRQLLSSIALTALAAAACQNAQQPTARATNAPGSGSGKASGSGSAGKASASGSGVQQAAGSASASGSGIAAGPGSEALAPPAKATAPLAIAGDGKVTLTWDETPLATEYRVLRAEAAGKTAGSTPLATGAARGYEDATAVDGKTYYYAIVAVNAAGDGPASDEVSATPLKVLGETAGFSVVGRQGRLVVTWTAAPDVAYLIETAESEDFAKGLRSFPDATSPFTVPDAAPGTQLFTRLKASGAGAVPVVSPAAAAAAYELPGVPVNITGQGGSRTATFTWQAVADATGYRVYTHAGGAEATAADAFVDVPQATVTFPNVDNGVVLSVVVRAMRNDDLGPLAVPATVTPAIPAACTLKYATPMALAAIPDAAGAQLGIAKFYGKPASTLAAVQLADYRGTGAAALAGLFLCRADGKILAYRHAQPGDSEGVVLKPVLFDNIRLEGVDALTVVAVLADDTSFKQAFPVAYATTVNDLPVRDLAGPAVPAGFTGAMTVLRLDPLPGSFAADAGTTIPNTFNSGTTLSLLTAQVGAGWSTQALPSGAFITDVMGRTVAAVNPASQQTYCVYVPVSNIYYRTMQRFS